MHVSTDEVYGSLGAEGLFTETTPYEPRSPYSASKAASDHLVRAWHATYGLPTLITNCSNNYGCYQFPEKLIPLMILKGLAGQPMPVYGAGGNVRDWLYRRRPRASASRSCSIDGRVGETYNIGGRSERSNIDVVTAICELLDRDAARGCAARAADHLCRGPAGPRSPLRDRCEQDPAQSSAGEPQETLRRRRLQRTVRVVSEQRGWWRAIVERTYRVERLGSSRRDRTTAKDEACLEGSGPRQPRSGGPGTACGAAWPRGTRSRRRGAAASSIITDPASTTRLRHAAAPDIVINAAAYTAVDKAESDREHAFAVNATGPGRWPPPARGTGAPLVHLSTDYVFDGTATAPYREDDPVAPLSAYGRSKAAGEAAVRLRQPRHIILRTSWVYAARRAEFREDHAAARRRARELSASSPTSTAPDRGRAISPRHRNDRIAA